MVYLTLTTPQRKAKSYIRGDYSTDTIYTFFRYRQVSAFFAKKEGTTTRVTDLLAEDMLQAQLITPTQLSDYLSAIRSRYYHKDCHPEESPEDIYRFICESRVAFFGKEAMEKAWLMKKETGYPTVASGIDQSEQKDALMDSCQAVIFILTQPELFSQMEADVRQVLAAGKQAYVCIRSESASQLPADFPCGTLLPATRDGISYDPGLQDRIDKNEACIFYYGEEGLLHLRDLQVDAIVHAVPTGYHAQALCNMLGQDRYCVVYIPKGRDITPFVPLNRRSRLTFYHLAQLAKRYGMEIYDLTTQQLYDRYPEFFISIYDSNGSTLSFPVSGDNFREFDAGREAAVAAYLESFSNIRYTAAYFDPEGNRQPIDYDESKKQSGILVHSIRVSRAKDSRVIACPKNQTPRQLLETIPGTALCSNFLFFLTPKLGGLYNDLRADRPREQADAAAGHLDYMLRYQDGKRIETFPLFQKTCIAATTEGEFLFFNFRLGAGSIILNHRTIRWDKTDVDPLNPGQVCIYTPFFSSADEDADRETYRKTVGAGRLNFVILQDRVTCIRQGDVVLPSVGVVLSMTPEAAAPLISQLTPLADGYFDPSSLALQVQLTPPEGIKPSLWEKLQWVYGGGMSLIRDGEGLCDKDMTQWLRRDGWMTPLSRQTQESVLHKLAKHPRTAIGTTEKGDLVILVYSGRTDRSSGADYREMVAIARTLYPDIRDLMNVDGGGSAVLALADNGRFLELSIPATSTGSCVGMVRPIHTLFYISAEKES